MRIVNRTAQSIAAAPEISSNRFDRTSRLPPLTDAGSIFLSLKRHLLAAIDRDRIVPIFILLAVGLRILFWAYTDRIWEDAIITLSPARNFWEGYGLTHHVPEPRIYSFTSTISILVFLIGEPFGQAINLMRVLSLVTAAGSIYFAARIMRHFGIHWLGQIVCLSYLATDHLQIFFGMAGMETQIATCITLSAIFFCLAGQLTWFGVFAGLALLARPEMLALAAIGFLYVLYKHRWAVWKPAVMALVIVGPWIAFTTFYYGSPIPQTITVKSWLTGQPSFEQMLEYAANLWKQFAPFWEYVFVLSIPVPRFLPALVTGLTALCALLGLIYAAIGIPLDDMLAEAAKAPAGYAFTTEEEWPELFIPSAAADVIAWHQAQFGTAYAYPVGPYFEVQKIPHATKLDRFHGHVLVVTGELDPFATGPDVEAFLNAVGTEKARARHLRQAGVGHMPYVEARAGEVQQAINDLVDAATAEV